MQHEDAGDRNQEDSIHGRYLITIVKIVRKVIESRVGLFWGGAPNPEEEYKTSSLPYDGPGTTSTAYNDNIDVE